MIDYVKIKEYFMNRGMKKNMQDLTILFLLGLLIVLTASFFVPSKNVSSGLLSNNEENKAEENTAVEHYYTNNYEDNIKHELVNVLGEIQGVGKVSVMIHFESGNEYLPAFNQNNSTKVTEESDSDGGKRITKENDSSTSIVTTNEGGNNTPFIVKEIKPKISGVIVIAEGAENPDVKYRLYEAVKTVFGIEQYKVNIYPMEKNK